MWVDGAEKDQFTQIIKATIYHIFYGNGVLVNIIVRLRYFLIFSIIFLHLKRVMYQSYFPWHKEVVAFSEFGFLASKLQLSKNRNEVILISEHCKSATLNSLHKEVPL